MHFKSEASKLIQHFFAMIKLQFHSSICKIRTDNGLEFLKANLQQFFSSLGVQHQHTCIGTPQQNVVVEQKHRHLLNVARSIRFQSHLPLQFWGECILTTTHLINRLPSKVLKGKTPYEILFGKTPTYTHLKVFCCFCFANNVLHKERKFDMQATPGIFIGYPYNKKGYKVYDYSSKKIFVSRDV